MPLTIFADQLTGNILEIYEISSRPTRKRRKPKDYWADAPYNTARDEESLWKAVIMQAMVDAVTCNDKPECNQHKLEAIDWLTHGSVDFIDVCIRAGLDPNSVRFRAKKAIANPGAWRTEAGKSARYFERRAMRERRRRERAEQLAEAVRHGCLIMYPFTNRSDYDL